MANLPAWQRLDRVVPSKPFGNGASGDYSSATIPTIKYKSCSGSASSTTLTADTDTAPFAQGDIILLHQSRGTGVGQWEVNKIASVGADEYTLSKALHFTYTDSGSSQAQAVVVPLYENVTVESGTWTIPAWDGDTGGILAFAVKEDLTVTGTITGNSAGFIGGAVPVTNPAPSGEGTAGASVQQTTANGNGGGGGNGEPNGAGSGAGGGNGDAGSDATSSGYGANATGGTEGGSADLLLFSFGGAGGCGGGTNRSQSSVPGAGGNGAGGIFIFANNVVSINSITLIGANGGNAYTAGSGYKEGGGGGGAGGSCLIECATATLGTEKIVATAGSGGNSLANSGVSGAGAVGRIAIHHSGAVTGTTSPTFEDIEDITLKEKTSGMFLVF